MKFVDEFRDPKAVRLLTDKIQRLVTNPWTLMEVCGGQTHSIMRYGLDQLLPSGVELLHGPGCPVCVTPQETIDRAIHIAKNPSVILATFGDMIRVPGSQQDLLSAKAEGADVRIVYSPMDAVELARQNPQRQVVFFGVGFETTAPANAMAVYLAEQQKLENFYLLSAHVLVPPAIEAILQSPMCRVQGFLAAGHVCTVSGCRDYEPIVEKYQVPIVVTGFEPVDILQGILMCLAQLESGRFEVENQYARSVKQDGNTAARELINKVFQEADQNWRGLAKIEMSGLSLRPEYGRFDAHLNFSAPAGADSLKQACVGECQSGLVLQGVIKPNQCPAFGVKCNPERPMGATMVSNEGACAAYYRYRLHDGEAVR